MLDVFITSRVRRKIIVVYAKYPDFKTHVRGLAKLIKEDAGNFHLSSNICHVYLGSSTLQRLCIQMDDLSGDNRFRDWPGFPE